MCAPQSIINAPSQMAPEDRAALERFTELYDKAEVYYAYDIVHKSVHSPFRTTHPDTLFNASRWVPSTAACTRQKLFCCIGL